MKKIAIIPARYASSRFPGKPLALLKDKPMVMWVYDAVKASGLFDKVVVATDDERIVAAVVSLGGEAMMTSSLLSCGTKRCEAVLSALEARGERFDLVVNVQGDEPLVDASQLSAVISLFEDKDCQIGTLAKRITKLEELQNPNCVKIVWSQNRAIYFSRSIIPYQRGRSESEYLQYHIYYKHIGLYAYKSSVLHKIVALETSLLEKAESLEQLCWLENGYRIDVTETDFESIGVDTPEDLERVNEMLDKQ